MTITTWCKIKRNKVKKNTSQKGIIIENASQERFKQLKIFIARCKNKENKVEAILVKSS